MSVSKPPVTQQVIDAAPDLLFACRIAVMAFDAGNKESIDFARIIVTSAIELASKQASDA